MTVSEENDYQTMTSLDTRSLKFCKYAHRHSGNCRFRHAFVSAHGLAPMLRRDEYGDHYRPGTEKIIISATGNIWGGGGGVH